MHRLAFVALGVLFACLPGARGAGAQGRILGHAHARETRALVEDQGRRERLVVSPASPSRIRAAAAHHAGRPLRRYEITIATIPAGHDTLRVVATTVVHVPRDPTDD